ncbi:MAG TPA: ABC transporter permease [Candidatus Latescibacteria bacterium]|nr:ABC transporter permease [Candidatus Handelsmanbacteria bacterium]HIL11990.1 ABC transporter permease [Candidatus Latescibacterota bacterium]
MLQYTIQRVLLAIPTLLGITLITFLIMRLAPGDPVDLFLGGAAGGEGISTDRQADMEKTREDLRRQLGLDQPLHMQYLIWLSRLVVQVEDLTAFERGALLADTLLGELSPVERTELAGLEGKQRKARFLEYFRRLSPDGVDALVESPFWQSRLFSVEGNYAYAGAGIEVLQTGDWRLVTLNFGRSFKDQERVIDHILDRLPITLEINLISLFFAYLIGVPLGILLSVKQNSAIDRLATTGTFMLWSMPSFWVGMLLILFFCNKEFYYWFPASGIQSLHASEEWSAWRLFTDHAHHMVLPILASTYSSFAGISRYMRTSMLENLRLDYVRTAQAKGLRYRVVVLRHVLRNSLIPIVTLLAGLLPGMIAGSVFIETIFTIPGLGFLGFQSVIVRDYPMAMALFTIAGALSLVGILVADILLKAVDPRIEFSGVQG